MTAALAPEVERLAQQHVNDAELRSTDDVLLAALHLFERYQTYRQLRSDLQVGFDQLERGEATTLADDQSLRAFFDQIKAWGRERLQASQVA